jgi:hypothetical protein
MTRRHQTRARTLRDFTFSERRDFVAAWEPQRHSWQRATRWATWGEYLDAYESVRDELLAKWRHRDKPVFAERALQVLDEQGIDVLETCTFEDVACYPDGWASDEEEDL